MALKPTTGLENHPVGTVGLNSIINANWERLEAIFAPFLSIGADALIAWDSTNKRFTARAAQETITYAATINLNFLGAITQKVTTAGNLNVSSTSNLAVGRRMVLVIVGDSFSRNLLWPAGWRWLGVAAPATIGIAKYMLIELISTGTTNNEVTARAFVAP